VPELAVVVVVVIVVDFVALGSMLMSPFSAKNLAFFLEN
jgi:hypothetical protein